MAMRRPGERCPDGNLLWSRPFTGHAIACGNNRMMLVGVREWKEGAPVFAELLDAASGEGLATTPCTTWPHHAAFDAHTDSVVLVSDAGIEIVEDLPKLGNVAATKPKKEGRVAEVR